MAYHATMDTDWKDPQRLTTPPWTRNSRIRNQTCSLWLGVILFRRANSAAFFEHYDPTPNGWPCCLELGGIRFCKVEIGMIRFQKVNYTRTCVRLSAFGPPTPEGGPKALGSVYLWLEVTCLYLCNRGNPVPLWNIHLQNDHATFLPSQYILSLLWYFDPVTFYYCDTSSLERFTNATFHPCNILLLQHFDSVRCYYCDI